MKKTTLKRLVESELVRVHRGGYIVVHNNKPVGSVIEYLIKHFFARPNKNSKAPYNGRQEIFFGQANSLPVEISNVYIFYEPEFTSLNLRCCDSDTYEQVVALIAKQGFASYRIFRARADQIFFSQKLGFAIRLVLVHEVAQDPAITEGIHHSKPTSKRRIVSCSTPPDEEADNPPTGADLKK